MQLEKGRRIGNEFDASQEDAPMGGGLWGPGGSNIPSVMGGFGGFRAIDNWRGYGDMRFEKPGFGTFNDEAGGRFGGPSARGLDPRGPGASAAPVVPPWRGPSGNGFGTGPKGFGSGSNGFGTGKPMGFGSAYSLILDSILTAPRAKQ